MRKTIVMFMIIGAVAGLNFYVCADEQGEDKKDVTIKGEVMDLTCYASHPDTSKGSGHAKCAKQCLEKGLPAGILTQDGVLYVALGVQHGTANEKLAPYAGQVVEVQGHVKEMNNVKFFEVEKVAEASEAPAAAPSEEEKPYSHEGHEH